MAARKRQLEWTAAALAEFAEAMNYYAERNPRAARRMTDEILKATELLIAEPIATAGRPGRMSGTSERILSRRTPFILVYRQSPLDLCKFFVSSTTPENTRESLRIKAATDPLNICPTPKGC